MKYKIKYLISLFIIVMLYLSIDCNALIGPMLDDNNDKNNSNPFIPNNEIKDNPFTRFDESKTIELPELPDLDKLTDEEEAEYMKSYYEKLREYMSTIEEDLNNTEDKYASYLNPFRYPETIFKYSIIKEQERPNSIEEEMKKSLIPLDLHNSQNQSYLINHSFTSIFSSYNSVAGLYMNKNTNNFLENEEDENKPQKPKSSISSILGKTTNYDLKKYIIDIDESFYFDNLIRSLSSTIAGSNHSIDTFLDLWIDGYVVPGLDYCANGCHEMVPQGICIAKDYLFITEYCHCESEHNSAVCILDKDTGEYIKTVILNSGAHVGGITYYDSGIGPQYIFITGHGKDDDDGLAIIMRYNYEDFVLANDGDKISKRLDITVEVERASFVSYNKFNNSLYVGYYRDLNPLSGSSKFYIVPIQNGTVNSDGGRTQENALRQMQGCEFISKDYGIITTSGGPVNSMMYINGMCSAGTLASKYSGFICCPPYLEEIAIDFETGKMYCIFESGAKPYSDYYDASYYVDTLPSIDRVVVLDFKDYITQYGGKLTGPVS